MKNYLFAFFILIITGLHAQTFELQKMKQTARRVNFTFERYIEVNTKGTAVVKFTIKFPQEYFYRKAYMEVNPSLITKTGIIRMNKKYLQGDKAKGEFQTISFKKGGVFDYADLIRYSSSMGASVKMKLDITVFENPEDHPGKKVYFSPVEIGLLIKKEETTTVVAVDDKKTKPKTDEKKENAKEIKIDTVVKATDTIKATDTVKEKETKLPKEEVLVEEKPQLAGIESIIAKANTYWENKQYIAGIKTLENGLDTLQDIGSEPEANRIRGHLAVYYQHVGRYDKSIDNYKKLYDYYIAKGAMEDALNISQLIGILHFNLNDFSEAQNVFLQSIALHKRKDGFNDLIYNNIGVVVSESSELEQSLSFLTKASNVSLGSSKGDKINKSKISNNFGHLYYKRQDYELAKDYFAKALLLREQTGDSSGLALNLYNMGNVNYKLSKQNLAIENFENSLKIAQRLHLSDLITLNNYALAEIHLNNTDCDNVKYCQKFAAVSFLNFFKGKTLPEFIVFTQNENTALLTELNSVKNSLLKQKVVAQAQEREIVLLNQNAALKNMELQRANNLLYYLISILLIILLVGIYVYRQYLYKRKANRELTEQNEIINQQNEEIRTQNEILSDQNEKIAKQSEIVNSQNRDITDSIVYAKRIQEALLPAQLELSKMLADNFVMLKPRDIVSGDFYWFGKHDNKIVVVAADCTGHGVPGAFMSMLGISFLNEIVNNKHIADAGIILDDLRNKVKVSLKQKGKDMEQKDGMDISLCIIDNQEHSMQFSGAFNSAYIIRENDKEIIVKDEKRLKVMEYNNKTLIELKADRQPVAIYVRETNFYSNEIKLQNNDCIYLYSDGYADQIGGENNSKYLSKNFKKQLTNIAHLPMQQQRDQLEQNFETWKGKEEQLDDVLVIGIKVTI